jgi:hypothetical protein
MYLSCVDWQLVNLPVSGDINLATLWNDSDMRIVLYESPPSEINSSKKKQQHLQRLNRYAFTLQLRYLGKQEQQQQDEREQKKNVDLPIDDTTEREADDFIATEASFRRSSLKRVDSSAMMVALGGGLVAASTTTKTHDDLYGDDDDDSLFFFDALEDHHESHGADATAAASATGTISMPQSPMRRFSKGAELLAKIDSAVPAWIDMLSSSSTGIGGRSYTRVYAISSTGTSAAGNATRFCSKQSCTVFMEESGTSWQDVSNLLDDAFSSRLSHAERTRRGLALFLDPSVVDVQPTSQQRTRMEAFVAQNCVVDKQFLRGRTEPTVRRPAPLISGFCARAHSDRHWVEEWVKVSAVNLMVSFYNPDKMRHPHLRIAITSIDKVIARSGSGPEAADDEYSEAPNMPEFSFLKIHQLYGRTIDLMFASESERDRWLEFLVNMIPPTGSSPVATRGGGGGENSVGSAGDTTIGSAARAWAMGFVDDPIEQFFHNSSM